jgi:hypothetical protein
MAVETRLELLVPEVAGDVVGEDLCLEVRDRPSFRGREVGSVAERKHVRLHARLQRVPVGWDEPECICEPRRALEICGATVERNRDEEVEVEFAAVIRLELAADSVDLAGVEVGDELDLLVGQK